MRRNLIPVALVALLAIGGNASSVSVGAVSLTNGGPCTPTVLDYTFSKTFDLVVTPGTRVVVAGNAAGTIPFWIVGHLTLRVDNPLGGSVVRTVAFPYTGTPCTPQTFGPVDVTDAFSLTPGTTSPVTLSVTATFKAWNCNCPAPAYWSSSPIFLAGVGGLGVASVQG